MVNKMSENLIGTIKTEGLTKIYRVKQKKGLFKSEIKEIHALKGISLDIQKGEVFGLLGPNGAGKTTFIKILTTLLLPDGGRAFVNGFDVVKYPYSVKKTIGVMLMGERSLYWKLTGRENLEYFAALYHIPSRQVKKRVSEVIDFTGIQDFADRLVETYSSGQKMALAFAKALLNDAPVLFLDEPTNAMDPGRAIEVRKIIKKLKDEFGKTILITTHMMHEADAICDRVAIIDKGKIMALGTPTELKQTVKHRGVIELDVLGNNIKSILPELEKIDSIEKVVYSFDSNNGELIKVRVLCERPRIALPEVVTIFSRHSAKVSSVNLLEPTLEDVFIQYTGRRLSEDTREGDGE